MHYKSRISFFQNWIFRIGHGFEYKLYPTYL